MSRFSRENLSQIWERDGHLWIGALLPALWVLFQLDAPIVEDSLFWWVPKALMAAELGPQTAFALSLPQEVLSGLNDQTIPPQWTGGLPDYGHPPLWYWYLAFFLKISVSVQAIHLACLLPAIMMGLGFAVLGAQVGNRWSGLAVLCLPPVLAQLLRPELDLPLLAVVPWALVALVRGQWVRFAFLGALAAWIKEPGVLLLIPAMIKAWQERRIRPEALAPLLGLVAWAAVYGRLATPERSPSDFMGWVSDLWASTRIMGLEQGRFLLLVGLGFAWTRCRARPRDVCLGFVWTWLVFFSLVGFLGGRDTIEPLTHVRYFVPGMAVLATVCAARWPLLAVIGLGWIQMRSPFGPEASTFGIDMSRCEAQASAWIAERSDQGHSVWVGSYTAAGLTQPWAGIVEEPIERFHVYSGETEADDIPNGAIFIEAAYGEPVAAIKNGLNVTELERWQVGEAWLIAWQVQEHGNFGVGAPLQ
jgi:hypothetical protein